MKYLKSPKISGELITNKDFIVNEILHPRFSRFKRTDKGVQRVNSGKQTLFLMKKDGFTTKNSLMEVAKQLDVSFQLFKYAGLKDKNAITTQYITAKIPESELKKFKHPNIALYDFRKTDKQMLPGHLKENSFIITIHNCKNLENTPKLIEEINKKGIPNYFGKQRFGKYQDNHKVGKKILKTHETTLNKYDSKFMINAYQSFIFNKMLTIAINSKKIPKELPIIGLNTRLTKDSKEILNKEKISQKDFKLDRLGISCKGAVRQTMLNPDIKYSIKKETITFKFTLPPGSYATVVLDQLIS